MSLQPFNPDTLAQPAEIRSGSIAPAVFTKALIFGAFVGLLVPGKWGIRLLAALLVITIVMHRATVEGIISAVSGISVAQLEA